MRKLPIFEDSVARNIFIAEWVLLIVAIFFSALSWRFAPAHPGAPNLPLSVAVLALMACTSLNLPTNLPRWQRFILMVLDLAFVTVAAAAGVARYCFMLYAVVVAKSCLVLDSRGIKLIVAISFLFQVICSAYKLKIGEEIYRDKDWLSIAPTLLSEGLILNISYGALMVFVALLTRTWINEQKLRLEQERLSHELEQMAAELERTRIAREIHDGLGHTLTSLKIQLEVARKFADRDVSKSQEALQLAETLASRSLTDVRVAIQSIRNSNFNFENAVSELVKEVENSGALQIELGIETAPNNSAVGYQLFRVVQECITNTLKHAEAKQLSISLRKSDGNLHLQVQDDGRGIASDTTRAEGFGLKGMRERVAGLQGQVELQSQEGQGTRISVTIPCES